MTSMHLLPRVLMLALWLSLVASACGGGAGTAADLGGAGGSGQSNGDDGIVTENGVARMTSALSRRVPDLTAAELSQLVSDNTGFAVELYQQLATETPGDNFFYSPHSISTAMAMAYVGARSTTRDAIQQALNFNLGDDALHQGFNVLARALAERQQPSTDDSPGLVLRTVNDIWASEVPIERPLQTYVDALALDYDAKVSLVDFSDPEATVETINGEVSRQTAGTIEDLLSPDDIVPGETTLVLTNALYFKAAWAQPFEESSTAPAAFHNLDGSETEVDMMAAIGSYEYVETDAAQALRLRYVGNETALLLLLPKGELSSFEAILDGEALGELRASLSQRGVQVRLPAFSSRSSFHMKPTLMSLGMFAGFDDQGVYDFSGIGSHQQFISDVVHQAFIAIDEAGTEAGAATAVIIGGESAGPLAEVDFIADRPFIYLLEDVSTGTLLFAGRRVKAE